MPSRPPRPLSRLPRFAGVPHEAERLGSSATVFVRLSCAGTDSFSIRRERVAQDVNCAVFLHGDFQHLIYKILLADLIERDLEQRELIVERHAADGSADANEAGMELHFAFRRILIRRSVTTFAPRRGPAARLGRPRGGAACA